MDRSKGIGGTDIGAIIGVNPWRGPMDVYLEKVGITEGQPDNENMFWGREMEPGFAKRYQRGPFYKDNPDPEKSLFWFATNTSKRGITLNVETPDGQDLFRRLVKTADVVAESNKPGYMDCLGLGYADLKEIKPDIIFTSITPFGQTGPYAHYQATDLVGAAMGGMARILGDLGRPPVRMGADPQSYFHAGLQGALGSMVAYYHLEMTGVGQHVDVSMQDAVELTLMNVSRYMSY